MDTLGPATNWIEVFPGVHRRRISKGERSYQMEVRLDLGSEVPMHQHPHEQVSYVASGRLRFVVGDQVIEAGPGASIAIPGGVPHAVYTLEAGLAIDTFTPVREDYLAKDLEADAA